MKSKRYPNQLKWGKQLDEEASIIHYGFRARVRRRGMRRGER